MTARAHAAAQGGDPRAGAAGNEEHPQDTTIPAELRSLDRWVAWALVPGERGEPVKVLFQTSGREASSTDPKTWTTCTRAAAAAERLGMEGLGIVLGDGLVGIDLDHCVEDGVIAPWAMEIIEAIDSYTEFSPSATGVHILAWGDSLPAQGRKRGNIEVYDSGRYFTFTGEVLPGRETVEERTEALTAWHARAFPPKVNNNNTDGPRPVGLDDRALLDKALRDDAKFARLWRGDIAGYPSASEADLGLCNKLAFWTGRDPERMDRLFRSSGLMRPKWDEFRGERTYGAITIAEACAGTTETYSPGVRAEYSDWWRPNGNGAAREQGEAAEQGNSVSPLRFTIRTTSELLDTPNPEWLVKDVIPRPGVGLLYSPSGLGKSFVKLDLACCVATGLPWLGHEVVQGDVLYIAAEGQSGFKRRLQAWQSRHGVTVDRLFWVTVAPQFMHEEDVQEILAALALAGVHPVLIIIDTLSRTLVGGDENSSKDMGSYLASLEALKTATEAAIWVVHHVGHNAQDRPRGSSTIMPAVDTLIALTGDRETHHLTLTCEKQKDDEEFAPIYLKLVKESYGDGEKDYSLVVEEMDEVTANGRLSANEQLAVTRLAEMGAEGASTTRWLAVCAPMTERTFYRAKAGLEAKFLVHNTGTAKRTQWVLPNLPTTATEEMAGPVNGTAILPHSFRSGSSGSDTPPTLFGCGQCMYCKRDEPQLCYSPRPAAR